MINLLSIILSYYGQGTSGINLTNLTFRLFKPLIERIPKIVVIIDFWVGTTAHNVMKFHIWIPIVMWAFPATLHFHNN